MFGRISFSSFSLHNMEENILGDHVDGLSASAATDYTCHTFLQMMAAVRILIQGVGEDEEREGLLKTPLRVASAFLSAISGHRLQAKEFIQGALFSEVGVGSGTGCGGGYGGMVVVRNIELFALCESCLLPFKIRCHVAYIPSGQRVVGLSKFARVAEMFAKRLQNPHRFAEEVVQALADSFQPLGVAAAVESWHLPWPSPCERKTRLSLSADKEQLGFDDWAYTPAYAANGQFESGIGGASDEFLLILQMDGIEVERPYIGMTSSQVNKRKYCPFRLGDADLIPTLEASNNVPQESSCNGSSVCKPKNGSGLKQVSVGSVASMVVAVQSLLAAMGEDLSREELRSTPLQYVSWLLTATQGTRCSLSDGFYEGIDNVVPCLNGIDCGFTGSSSFTNGPDHALDGFKSNVSNPIPKSTCGLRGFAPQTNGCDHSLSGKIKSDLRVHGREAHLTRLPSSCKDNYHMEDCLKVELDVSFCSVCEHHLLPFFGVLHLGYIGSTGKGHIDRSELLRIVRLFSMRLQVQERLTRQVAEAVVAYGAFQGVMVVVEASHMCMMSRGVEKPDSTTVTFATIGQFSTDRTTRTSFLQKIPKRVVKNTGGEPKKLMTENQVAAYRAAD